MNIQPAGLISVLLDDSAEFGDRDDAAMDLSKYDDEDAEKALAKVATNTASEGDLAESCGESLAEIWCRKERIDFEVFDNLAPAIKVMALAYVQAHNASLVEERS